MPNVPQAPSIPAPVTDAGRGANHQIVYAPLRRRFVVTAITPDVLSSLSTLDTPVITVPVGVEVAPAQTIEESTFGAVTVDTSAGVLSVSLVAVRINSLSVLTPPLFNSNVVNIAVPRLAESSYFGSVVAVGYQPPPGGDIIVPDADGHIAVLFNHYTNGTSTSLGMVSGACRFDFVLREDGLVDTTLVWTYFNGANSAACNLGYWVGGDRHADVLNSHLVWADGALQPSVYLDAFSPGTQIVLEIGWVWGPWYSGPATNNPDGRLHAIVLDQFQAVPPFTVPTAVGGGYGTF